LRELQLDGLFVIL